MGEKRDLAEIGEVLGKKLEERGFDKAYSVLGHLKNGEDLLQKWLKDSCSAIAKQSWDFFGCL
ncbi:barrier-to-autointegration factor-like [Trichechus inunguis]